MSYKLLVSIVPHNSGELICNAAKSVGAGGGTIAMGRGTASNGVLQLLGLGDTSKDIVYIIVKNSLKAAVYDAIIAASEKHNAKLIWPTWPSIKVGPWIRHEKDKRTYVGLFSNRTGLCGGIKKYLKLCFSRKIHTKDLDAVDWGNLGENDIVIYDDFNLAPGEFQMNFNGTREYRERIAEIIYSNLGKKGKKAFSFDASGAICVHVRLGDFSKTTAALDTGKNNMRIRIDWYVAMVNKLRDAAGWTVPVFVFSDGTDEELSELTALPEVRRLTFGNSIGDIVGLSRFSIIIRYNYSIFTTC